MEARIVSELRFFLMEHKISARRLALEAGVTPVTVTRVLSRERKDMVSAKADALRAAMARLSPTATPSTPTEPEEVKHAEPDKDVQGEQLDDVERLADLQRAIRRNAPQKVRAKLLGALIIDLMETETAVQHEGRKGECRS